MIILHHKNSDIKTGLTWITDDKSIQNLVVQSFQMFLSLATLVSISGLPTT